MTTPETPAESERRKRRLFIAAIAGVLLALACRALPPEYQKPCATIVHLCTGG